MLNLRQGDPLSPMLFNIVANMLAIMIERTKNDGLIEGVIPHLVDGGFLSFNMPMGVLSNMVLHMISFFSFA
jgi:hypothetical protein